MLLCCVCFVRKDNTEEDDDDKDSDGDNTNDTKNLSDYSFCTLPDDTGLLLWILGRGRGRRMITQSFL